jgi:hypothetical protein
MAMMVAMAQTDERVNVVETVKVKQFLQMVRR